MYSVVRVCVTTQNIDQWAGIRTKPPQTGAFILSPSTVANGISI